MPLPCRKRATNLLKILRPWLTIAVFFSVFCFSLLFSKPVFADALGAAWDFVAGTILGNVLLLLISLLGKFLIVVIDILIGIAQYSDFIHAGAVEKGWIVLRDVCNMFFIVILLVIAFSTVLSIEKYSYKRLLPMLLIMAVLINFSRMIAGVFIDMAQVVTMTFVNGFKYAAAGNLTTAFGLQDLLKYRDDPNLEINVTETVASLLLALIMLLIAVIVTGVIAVVFIVRIIALWILVVLSPVAYLAAAAPGGQKYSSMWWSSFSKYVTIGPILAFFLWLSFAVMGSPNDIDRVRKYGKTGEELTKAGGAGGITATISKAGSSENILSFAISIAMLMGALMAAQQVGGVAGSLAGKMQGKISGAGMKALKYTSPAYLGYKGVKKSASYGLRELAAKTGLELRPSKIKETIKTALTRRAEAKELEAVAKKGELLEKGGFRSKFAVGAPGWVDQNLRGFLGLKGMFGKGGLFRGTPTAGQLDKKGEEIEEKKKKQESIKERLAKGAVADGYIEELEEEFKSENGKKKAINLQIGDIDGTNLKKQAADLEIQAKEADIAKDTNKAQNLRDQARVLENRGNELKTQSTSDPEKIAKITALETERNEHTAKAKSAIQRRSGLRNINDTNVAAYNALHGTSYGSAHDAREGEAKRDLTAKVALLQTEINDTKISTQGSTGTKGTNFSKEQDEAWDGLQKEIAKLTTEIGSWTPGSDQEKELTKRKNVLIREQNKIGSTEDKETRLTALEMKKATILERISGTPLSEDEKKKLQEEEKGLEKETKKLEDKFKALQGAIPRDYYARQARRQAWAEERRKIDTKEEDELIDLFEGALARKEKTLAAALATQIAASYGLNTLVNNHGFDSDVPGLNAFTNQVLRKKLGMSEQEALSLENDMCEIAANQSNHLTFAKGVGVKNGRYIQQGGERIGADPKGLINQQYYSYVEMSKLDKETIARRYNRLGYGKEDKDGNFSFNPAGLWWIRDNWGTILSEMAPGRQRFNSNAAQKFVQPQAMRQLRSLMSVIDPSKIRDFMDFLDRLEAYGSRTTPSREEDMKALARMFNIVI